MPDHLTKNTRTHFQSYVNLVCQQNDVNPPGPRPGFIRQRSADVFKSIQKNVRADNNTSIVMVIQFVWLEVYLCLGLLVVVELGHRGSTVPLETYLKHMPMPI